MQLVAVVPRTAENTTPSTDSEGVGGVTTIPETQHSNGHCDCLELVNNNPVEFTLFSTWCLPRECKNLLENSSFSARGANEVNRYLNTTMTFFSYLSEIGTIYLSEATAEDTAVQREQRAGKGLYTAGGEGGPSEEAGGAESCDGTDEQT